MFAVIKTGGKQYKVAKDDIIKVEKLDGEAGQSIDLDQVLMVGDGKGTTLGAPLVEGASVQAEVLEQGRADKIVVFKRKRRKDYRRTTGHRQDLTVLRVTSITPTPGAKQKAAPKKTEAKASPQPTAKAKKPAEARKAPKTAAAEKPAPKKTAAKAKAAPEKKAAADKPAAKKKKKKKAAPRKKTPAKSRGKEK